VVKSFRINGEIYHMVKRNELKFFISSTEYIVLKRRLAAVMPADKHDAGEGYRVRSLYFDSLGNKAFWEKEAGVSVRRKYRLRLYDLDSNLVKFEIKNKVGNQILKETAWISRTDADLVQKGDYSALLKYSNKVLRKIYYSFKKEKYVPVVMVDYVREPYVLPFNNIRITFDREISSGSCFNIFKKGVTSSVLKKGMVVLEVKYDGFIPSWLKRLLQIEHFERSAISKYCNGRMVKENVYLGI